MATLRFDGKSVSAEWYAVLSAARADGVGFHLNSGRRTLEEQAYLYQLYLRGGNLAARPLPNAPHIRVGRVDHAIDVESTDGGANRLASWMRKHGLAANFTVAREPWHIESISSALKGFTKKSDPLRALTKKERKMADRTLFHRREMGREAATGKGPKYKAHQKHAEDWKRRVEAQMRALRADADNKGGWGKDNRGDRYQALKLVVEDRDGRL